MNTINAVIVMLQVDLMLALYGLFAQFIYPVPFRLSRFIIDFSRHVYLYWLTESVLVPASAPVEA
jgi:hypothetical protein